MVNPVWLVTLWKRTIKVCPQLHKKGLNGDTTEVTLNTGEQSALPKYDPLCLETGSEFCSPAKDPPLYFTGVRASRICFSGRRTTRTESVPTKSGYLL